MAKKTLSHLSDIAEQEENVADITTPVLVIQPDSGTMLTLRNDVGVGEESGLPLFMDLRDSAGNQLATDTKLVLRALRPTDDEPVAVSVAENNIAAWNQLETPEQRNSDHIDNVKVELQGDRVNIRDKDELRVELNGPDVIDWDESEVYFHRDAVQERPFEG